MMMMVNYCGRQLHFPYVGTECAIKSKFVSGFVESSNWPKTKEVKTFFLLPRLPRPQSIVKELYKLSGYCCVVDCLMMSVTFFSYFLCVSSLHNNLVEFCCFSAMYNFPSNEAFRFRNHYQILPTTYKEEKLYIAEKQQNSTRLL